jgi:hypothetical protein
VVGEVALEAALLALGRAEVDDQGSAPCSCRTPTPLALGETS